MLIAGLVCSALGLLCGFLDLVIFLAAASQEADAGCEPRVSTTSALSIGAPVAPKLANGPRSLKIENLEGRV